VFSGRIDVSRFDEQLLGSGPRPSSALIPPSVAVTSSLLWDQILYINLVSKQRISESALLRAVKIVLKDRGTLPVGEIGKTLQELTSMHVISGKLKEAFGGLKKFLEMYPEEFVVCTDHPFNPHVFIRKGINEADLQQFLTSSHIPASLLARYRKVRCREALAVFESFCLCLD